MFICKKQKLKKSTISSILQKSVTNSVFYPTFNCQISSVYNYGEDKTSDPQIDK